MPHEPTTPDPAPQPEIEPAEKPAGETPEAEPVLGGFGVGPVPPELHRFNWGAFLLPLFWGFAYGAWPLMLWWVFSTSFPLVLLGALGFDEAAPGAVRMLIGVSVASEVVSGLARLWAGANANRLAWRREQLRLTVLPGVKPRMTAEWFLRRQRLWFIVGAVMMGLLVVPAALLNAQSWGEYGLEAMGLVEPFVWLIAEIGLGIWLARAMVAERATLGQR